MYMKKLFVLFILSILLVSCNKEQPKWEYKVICIEGIEFPLGAGLNYRHFEDPTSELNKAGANGWELVDVYTEVDTDFPNFGDQEYHTGIKSNTRTKKVFYVFKRLCRKNGNGQVTAQKEEEDSTAVDTGYYPVDSTAIEL